jgi:hypothetical protein
VQDVVTTGDYAAEGPHFLDWKALAEHGNVSMAAVPMHSCNKPVAVLCLASKQVSCQMHWLLLWHAGELSGISCGMHARACCSCEHNLCRWWQERATLSGIS